MSKCKYKLSITLALIFILSLSLSVSALEISHVGTIDQSLFAPTSLALSSDNLAVLEPFENSIKIFSVGGIIQQEVNIEGESNGLSRLSQDIYLFCDMKKKDVTAVDINEGSQSRFSSDGYVFVNPVDLLIDNDNVCILDAGKSSIEIFSTDGSHTKSVALPTNDSEFIEYAGSFSYNPVIHRYYILDQVNSVVWVIDSEGKFLSKFGSYGAGEGEITRGGEILATASGYVFVSDRYQNRIAVFNYWGEFIDNIDIFDSLGTSFKTPTGLAADNNGLLYVSSTEAKKIDIYHVVTSAVSETVTTSQTYPNAMDTVEIENLVIIAKADANIGSRDITGFDFELYADYDEVDIINSSQNNSVAVTTDSVLGVIHYSSQWSLNDTLENGKNYQWRTRVDFEDGTSGEWTDLRLFTTSPSPLLPDQFMLYQNYPNPFNPDTKIKFSLPAEDQAVLEIFNIIGQKIRTLIDERLPAGQHEVVWDSRDDSGNRAASGVYFYRLSSSGNVQTRKLVLLK